jgi:HlyD family secretion protein
MQANRDQSKRVLDRALEMRKTNANLISAEAVEQAQQAYDVAMATYASTSSQVDQARASLQEAKDNLAKTRIYAPIAGRVTRLAVEEGEVAVPGTFSRETGLLMTVADSASFSPRSMWTRPMSCASPWATRSPWRSMPSPTRRSWDASPRSATAPSWSRPGGAGGNTERRRRFRSRDQLDKPPTDIRPDLSATARIVTETRKQAMSIPIIALTVREHENLPNELKTPTVDSAKGGKKKEREASFVVHGGVASFVPVKVGIAGEEHFEVLEGLKVGRQHRGGPYQAIRDMRDSTRVKQQTRSRLRSGAPAHERRGNRAPRYSPPVRHGRRDRPRPARGVALDPAQRVRRDHGPSGSGKSTLMNLLGCLDTPTAASTGSTARKSRGCRRRAGAGAEPRDRLRLPDLQPAAARHRAPERRAAAGVRRRRRRSAARGAEALDAVGLGDRMDHRPTSSPADSASASRSRARW